MKVGFVYGPEGLISNPAGLKNNLGKLSISSLTVSKSLKKKWRYLASINYLGSGGWIRTSDL